MPVPSKVHLHRQSQRLELHFVGSAYSLPAEYLRVHSPSAEVRGHGPGQEKLQYGKQGVGFKDLQAQGNYAVKIAFDDGHDTGIFTWDYLYELATKYEHYWQAYLQRLQQEGKSRDPNESVVRFTP